MEQNIFESVLKAAKNNSDYSENEISFRGQVGLYLIEFYSVEPFKVLRTHKFGYEFMGKFVPDSPNPLQAQLMMEYINLEVPGYYKRKDDKQRDKDNHNDERPYICPYDDHGVSRKDFF